MSSPIITFAAALLLSAGAASAASPPSYNRDIRPILSDKCFACHGPDAAQRKGQLRLDVRDDAIKAGAIVPGNPQQSLLIERIHADDRSEVMPPPSFPRQLTPAERETLSAWIANGAIYEPLWSFVPLPETVAVPTPPAGIPTVNEIDAFIATRLASEQITPSPPAPAARWLRRVSFDLTGLPPSQEELDAFLADPSPQAREHAVDRLLASPHFGEAMAIPWLDAARYADSFGYQSDLDTHAWPYRDWVISAFNQNLPWDQFITWQLAGDLLPNPTDEQQIATAFNRIHRKTQEGGSVEEEYRQEGIADRVHTAGTAFLGLTFECSRCHDHKYDPISMRDYYSLGAYFNSIDEWGLLHGNGSIQPNPVLLMMTDEQKSLATSQRAAIEAAETDLTNHAASREAAFTAWLASPSAPAADRTGHYPLDVRDGESFPNTADPARLGKSNGKNTLVASPHGQALRFTGDDPLALGDHQVVHQEDPCSVSFRMLPTEAAKRAVIFHNSSGYDPGYNGFELLLEDGHLRWQVAREWPGCCISVRTREAVPLNEWTHVTVTYDGSSRAAGLKVFLNGQPATLDIVRDQLTRNCGSASAFTFGERVRDKGFRNGTIDDIHIHTRPITPLEVRSLHLAEDPATTVANTPRSPEGLTLLREYYLSAIDPEMRAKTSALRTLRQNLRKTLDQARELPVMREMPDPRPAWVLNRGAYDQPTGDPVPRATPAALPPLPGHFPNNRLGLAQWLTQPTHPLTARVQVNRIWQHFFGRGIVATTENFGSQGEPPAHPELLDWLARDFIRHGWNFKRLCKQITLSATYGRDSIAPPALRSQDPYNILLARGPAKRLGGETLRDQALALSGLLHRKTGGPPVKPYLPESAKWRVLNSFLPEYQRDNPPDIYRRSLYTYWRRTAPPPGMLAFDVPGRDVCTVRRQATNTPLQPLVMLNDPQFVEAARGLAIRMSRHGGADPASQAQWLFREALNRPPTAAELKLLDELRQTQLTLFEQDPQKAAAFLKTGDLAPPADIPAPQLAAATVLASAVLNLDEAITLR